MEIRTEKKHVIELDDLEVNELFDAIKQLEDDIPSFVKPVLYQLKALLWPVRNGH